MQAAYRTFEYHAHSVGKNEEGKETLAPISHIQSNAQIEITINTAGEFIKASQIAKEDNKTIIPATIESANRTGDNDRAHPLSDQLRYLYPFDSQNAKNNKKLDKFAAYLKQLEQWAHSEFTHPKVQAVLQYIQGETIISDLVNEGLISLDEQGQLANGKIAGTEYGKCLVRWRVDPFSPASCWTDESLFESYIAWYENTFTHEKRDLCLISGEEDTICEMHPKGTIVSNFSAKLVSANDDSGYTYRGRFSKADEAYSVGYRASQKAHAALRWVIANHGVRMGGRIFICWNPEGYKVPSLDFLDFSFTDKEEKSDFTSYKKKLFNTLSGFRQDLKPEDDVVIASLEAATTGRLSITYYNEIKALDFLVRIEEWYKSFCWRVRAGTQSPSLQQIVKCAFGVQRSMDKGYIDVNEKVLCEHVQRLLHCVVDRQSIPFDIVRALVTKTGNPLAYSQKNRYKLISTACAAIRKYQNDKNNKEVWTLELDLSNADRSYLFGRLLAVAELAERKTYNKDENKRETNAIRMMSVFSRRPMETWKIIRESLVPYFSKLKPGSRVFYEKLIDEISCKINPENPDLNKELDAVYLLGYSHQRNAIYSGKYKPDEEEDDNERSE